MLKYLSKFAMDILPSVAATIIGAYIVNHYITKPGTGAPVAAAVSTAEPKGGATVPARAATKPSETSSEVANIPGAGVKAKGISEKALSEKAAIEKSAAEKPADKPPEKSADKPTETASIPAETRRHQVGPREKAAPKTVSTPVQPSTAQPSASVAVPVVVAPASPPSVEATSPVEDHRDANELARAAIERLRGPGEGSPRAQEAARVPDTARIPDPSRVVSAPPVSAPLPSAPPVRPLPPPIMVSTPSGETLDPAASSQAKPPYAAARADDPSRPTPPAEIPPAPASRPLDLHAEAAEPSEREHTTVAEEMLSAAKSVFHAVLPK